MGDGLDKCDEATKGNGLSGRQPAQARRGKHRWFTPRCYCACPWHASVVHRRPAHAGPIRGAAACATSPSPSTRPGCRSCASPLPARGWSARTPARSRPAATGAPSTRSACPPLTGPAGSSWSTSTSPASRRSGSAKWFTRWPWPGSRGSRPGVVSCGGASPTAPRPSPPSLPRSRPPEPGDRDDPFDDVPGAGCPGRFGGRGARLGLACSALVLVGARVPGQGHPRVSDVGARRRLLRAGGQAPPLAVDPGCCPPRGQPAPDQCPAGRAPPRPPGGGSARSRLRGLLRPNARGWSVRIRLHEGQVPDDYIRAAEQLAHAWRVHAVRVTATAPGRVWLLATRTDPLTNVSITPEAGELLTVRPGMLETGQPWVIDFRTVPHWLNAGATQSGKSNLANAIIKGLAPQPVALAGFDLKGGVEFPPYAPRLSALATTRAGELRSA